MRDLVGRIGKQLSLSGIWLVLLAVPGLGVFADDCNRNGIEDELELAADEANLDCDGDGVLDECQLSPVDRNVLRLAIYELLPGSVAPPKVAINEAVELAKEFGGEASARFVNGVLGSAFEQLAAAGTIPTD